MGKRNIAINYQIKKTWASLKNLPLTKKKKMQKLEDLKKLSIEYGVPMPETSIKLDWKQDTMFYWGIDHNDKWHLIFKEISNNDTLNYDKIYKAPQAHQIIKNIPQILVVGENIMYFDLKSYTRLNESFYFLQYTETSKNRSYFDIGIKDNHLAEAFAKLHISLKKEHFI